MLLIIKKDKAEHIEDKLHKVKACINELMEYFHDSMEERDEYRDRARDRDDYRDRDGYDEDRDMARGRGRGRGRY